MRGLDKVRDPITPCPALNMACPRLLTGVGLEHDSISKLRVIVVARYRRIRSVAGMVRSLWGLWDVLGY